MSGRTVGLIVSSLVAVVSVAVVMAVLVSTEDSPPRQATPQSAAPTATLSIAAPAVATLSPNQFLWVHEAPAATVEFGPGVVIISAPATDENLRLIDSAAPADGGRTEVDDARLAAIPTLLPVVVSYDTQDGPRSIFGRLATSPTLTESEGVSYTLTVYDAPGRGSTYTVSGSYEIPDTLTSVRVIIAGQEVQ